MVSGRDTGKVQAYNQCIITDTWSKASGRNDYQSFGVLQEHPTYHPLLWGHSQKPHRKQLFCYTSDNSLNKENTSEVIISLCFQKLLDVQDFLRVPRLDLKSRQVKIHKGPLYNHIQNWDDVQKALNKTRYESFLHADYWR